jgi:hypothetical protein
LYPAYRISAIFAGTVDSFKMKRASALLFKRG